MKYIGLVRAFIGNAIHVLATVTQFQALIKVARIKVKVKHTAYFDRVLYAQHSNYIEIIRHIFSHICAYHYSKDSKNMNKKLKNQPVFTVRV